MHITETLNSGLEISQIYYVLATIIIGVLGYFIKDLHKLIKSLNTTVQELNTTVVVIRETNEKELQMINSTISDRTRRISNLEDQIREHDKDITDFYKNYPEKIREIIRHELK